VVALDAFERIQAGVDPTPQGQKLSPDKTSLEPMTVQEQVDSGQMDKETGVTLLALQVRTERDALLAGSDWTQIPDAKITADKKTAWATYREALRNVPQQGGFPWSVTWPTNPDGVTP
jgi:hypothetical protein